MPDFVIEVVPLLAITELIVPLVPVPPRVSVLLLVAVERSPELPMVKAVEPLLLAMPPVPTWR